jgi:hypothetical protein
MGRLAAGCALWPLLLAASLAGAEAEPAPDAELLLFLAEFASEEGELVEPALLQHAEGELDKPDPNETEADTDTRPREAQQERRRESMRPSAQPTRMHSRAGRAERRR